MGLFYTFISFYYFHMSQSIDVDVLKREMLTKLRAFGESRVKIANINSSLNASVSEKEKALNLLIEEGIVMRERQRGYVLMLRDHSTVQDTNHVGHWDESSTNISLIDELTKNGVDVPNSNTVSLSPKTLNSKSLAFHVSEFKTGHSFFLE